MDKDLLLKLLLFFRASLVAQWQRIHLPMQETRVQSLIQEDPTCQGAAKPMCHNYWACALKPGSRNSWAWLLQMLSPCAATAEPRLQLLCPYAATAEPRLQLLSPCAATAEPRLQRLQLRHLEPVFCIKKSHHSEKPVRHNRRKARVSNEGPAQPT